MNYLPRTHWGAEPHLNSTPVSMRLKGVCLHWMGFAIHDDPLVVVIDSIDLVEQLTVWAKGEENRSISSSSAIVLSFGCHSQGV